MAYEDEKVVILDDAGNVAGTKPRKEIDRRADVLYTVHVFVFMPDRRFALARIPDGKPIYAGQWGSTAATLVQQGEMRDDAASRALNLELWIPNARPMFLGQNFDRVEGTVRRLHAAYQYEYTKDKLRFDHTKTAEIVYLTRGELEERIAKERATFAPTFLMLWERYKDRLSF